jgi:hypothetical protein
VHVLVNVNVPENVGFLFRVRFRARSRGVLPRFLREAGTALL